jgi:hypothetical protein
MWITSENQIINSPRGITINGIQHPQTIFYLWNKGQLASVGIRYYYPATCPEGHRVTGAYTEEIDGEVHERFTTEPIPQPEPPLPEPITTEENV